MKDLLTEIQETRTGLENAITAIPAGEYNTVPYKDGWTAAQVTEHVLKALNVDVLYGKTGPTHRAPDAQVAQTGAFFLNMDIKMRSPDFIYPSDKKHDETEMLAKVDDSFNKLTKAVNELDLSQTCLDFTLPGGEPFTRLEFAWFFVFHTQRHLNQFKKIKKALAA